MTTTTGIDEDIRLAAAGDRDAFGRLVEAHQTAVCTIAYGIVGDFALSEDIAQESFVLAWQRLGQLREPSRFGAWVAAIARRRALDTLRERGKVPMPRRDSEAAEVEDCQADAITDAERSEIVWKSVGTLPEPYRETLLLFYREGQSSAEVSAALNVSEACVRQRLSRGRAMLRDGLTDLVEDTLRATRPGTGFTLAVMAAVPAFAAPSAVAQTVATAKAGSTMTTGTLGAGGASIAGGLAGAIGGMTGGFFGMWMSIRNAPTLHSRRFMVWMAMLGYAFLWSFFAYQAAVGVLAWGHPQAMVTLVGGGWLLYIPLLLVAIVRGNDVYQRLIEGEADGSVEADLMALRCQPQALRRTMGWTFPLSLIMSTVVAWWVYRMMGDAAWWFIGIMALCHFVYYQLIQRGISLSLDDAVFQQTAPPTSQTGPSAPYIPEERRLRLNDAGALAGGIFGGACGIVIGSITEGALATGLVVAVLQTVLFITAVGIRYRWPDGRGLVFLVALTLSGAVDGVAITVEPAAWVRMLNDSFNVESATPAWSLLTAVILMGLYTAIGLVVYRMDAQRRRAR